MEVVGEAANGQETGDLARARHPGAVVMDIRMPGTDGLAATAAIYDDPELSGHVGASGLLGKYVTTDVLLAGTRTVASGEALLSPGATRALITRFLTGRPGPPAGTPGTPRSSSSRAS